MDDSSEESDKEDSPQ